MASRNVPLSIRFCKMRVSAFVLYVALSHCSVVLTFNLILSRKSYYRCVYGIIIFLGEKDVVLTHILLCAPYIVGFLLLHPILRKAELPMLFLDVTSKQIDVQPHHIERTVTEDTL